MAIPFLSDIDLNKKQALQLVLHNSTSDPSGVEGQIYYNTSTNKVMTHNGSSFVTVGNTTAEVEDTAGGLFTGNTETGITATYQTGDNTVDLVTDVTLTNSVTLTNKTLTAPTLTTPALGTPASGVMTNATGTAANLTAGTATKITSITNSNIVQLTTSQTLTNKTLTAPILTTPALGTPSALVLTNATALPAAQVAQGTMASGMVLVAPVLGTPASGNLANCTFPSANINTDIDVNIANLTARLPQVTSSVTIGDASDVTVTTSGNLVVTGDLTVSGDTISANVATLNVEDKNITLNYSSSDSSSTANGSGITIQDAVDASTDATILWDASNDEFDFSHKINVTGGITGTILTASQTNITAVGTITTGTWAATDVAIAHGGTGASTASAAFDNLKQAATTSATGVVELATTTEASAGTDSSRATTADGLQQFHNDRNKSFVLNNTTSGVASGDNITYTITHGMGASRLYKIEIIESSGNYQTVYTDVKRPSDTTITVIFTSAVSAGAYTALIAKI